MEIILTNVSRNSTCVNQHLGTQQLFSLVNVELDGESQSFNVETDIRY